MIVGVAYVVLTIICSVIWYSWVGSSFKNRLKQKLRIRFWIFWYWKLNLLKRVLNILNGLIGLKLVWTKPNCLFKNPIWAKTPNKFQAQNTNDSFFWNLSPKYKTTDIKKCYRFSWDFVWMTTPLFSWMVDIF